MEKSFFQIVKIIICFPYFFAKEKIEEFFEQWKSGYWEGFWMMILLILGELSFAVIFVLGMSGHLVGGHIVGF